MSTSRGEPAHACRPLFELFLLFSDTNRFSLVERGGCRHGAARLVRVPGSRLVLLDIAPHPSCAPRDARSCLPNPRPPLASQTVSPSPTLLLRDALAAAAVAAANLATATTPPPPSPSLPHPSPTPPPSPPLPSRAPAGRPCDVRVVWCCSCSVMAWCMER